MLKLHVPEKEIWDEKLNKFIQIRSYDLTLEHSLYSISKWEQKYHKPFMSEEAKTREETCDYIKFMCFTKNIPDHVFDYMDDETIKKVNDYIADPATATWFNRQTQDGKGRVKNNQVITNELVYYWMTELGIPLEFEKRHFNHLMTLIEVINIKHEEQDPNKKNKMSKNDILRQNAKLNAARRKAMHSKG